MRLSSLLYTIFIIKLVRSEKKVTFDILKPDSNKTKVNVSKYSGLESKRYTPKDGFRINKVKYGDKQLWKSRLRHSDGCKIIEIYSKEETKLLVLNVVKGGSLEFKRFEEVGGKWNDITLATFNNKLNEAKKKGSKPAAGTTTSPEVSSQAPTTSKSTKLSRWSARCAETTPITLDLAHPDRSKVCVDDHYSNGVKTKKYSPKDGYHISSVLDDTREVWTLFYTNTKCKLVRVYSKDGIEILYLDINCSCDPFSKHFEKVNGEWDEIDLNVFDKKVKEIRGGSNPEELVSSLASKVDESLFDVEEAEEDTVKVLKLTAKEGAEATKLAFDGVSLWEDKKKLCSSAILYLDGDKPTLAVLETKDKDNVTKVYRYHDGKQWKNGNEGTHKSKLEALEKKCNPDLKSKVDSSLFNVEDGEENGFKVLKLTVKHGISTNNLTFDDKEIWSGSKTFSKSSNLVEALIYFYKEVPALVTIQTIKGGIKSTVYKYYDGSKWQDGNMDEHNKSLAALKKRCEPTIPITLDLASTDKSKVKIGTKEDKGLKHTTYTPNTGFKITSVVDGKAMLWTASGDEKCCFARCYTKGDTSFLYITIKGGNDLAAKFFEKSGNDWKILKEDEFNERVKTVMGGAVKYTSQFGSKVDSTLFNVLDSAEDYVPVLKLKAKEGVTNNKLTYGSDVVWEDKKKSCSSALLYMDGEKPTLAVLVTRDDKNNKQSEVYRYHDGKEWKNDKENDHNKKLEALKENCKPSITTTPFKLDITNPDRTKLTINDINNTGLPYREYVAKDGYHIDHIVDGQFDLWIAPKGEICIAVKSFIQDAVTIIAIFIKDGDTKRRKCVEKAGGRWKDIDGQTFEEKLKAIREERVAGNEGAGNDGSPFTLLPPEQITSKQNAENHTENMVNAYASEILGAPAKKPKVVPRAESANEGIATDEPESVTEDTEPQVPSGPLTNCTLDLSKPDEDEISVKENKNYGGGVTQKDFSPQAGFKIDYILNGGTPVIKLSEGEEFKHIRLYSKRTSNLLMLTMKKLGGLEHQYYEKRAEEWHNLNDQNEFDRKLNTMKTSR